MKVLAVIAAVALFGLVGQMDYEDAVTQEARYCSMTEQGLWGEYNPDIDCSRFKG